MSFLGMFGGMDLDKPFYKSRMFVGGTAACVALLAFEYYLDNFTPKKLTPEERAAQEEAEWAEEEARLQALRAKNTKVAAYLDSFNGSGVAAQSRPLDVIRSKNAAATSTSTTSTSATSTSATSTSATSTSATSTS